LLTRYISEFVTRWRECKTILFYELTNEMNLQIDRDLDALRLCDKGCSGPCVHGHFSTAEMNGFADHLVLLIRSFDPSRPVSSGYAILRSAATHLARKPGFAPGGPDFTLDSPEEFARHLTEVHKPFQKISIHVYSNRERACFGRPPGEEAELAEDAATARAAGKPLVVGEFGDSDATPFMTRLAREIVNSPGRICRGLGLGILPVLDLPDARQRAHGIQPRAGLPERCHSGVGAHRERARCAAARHGRRAAAFRADLATTLRHRRQPSRTARSDERAPAWLRTSSSWSTDDWSGRRRRFPILHALI
jgi:hypothetical protein